MTEMYHQYMQDVWVVPYTIFRVAPLCSFFVKKASSGELKQHFIFPLYGAGYFSCSIIPTRRASIKLLSLKWQPVKDCFQVCRKIHQFAFKRWFCKPIPPLMITEEGMCILFAGLVLRDSKLPLSSEYQVQCWRAFGFIAYHFEVSP